MGLMRNLFNDSLEGAAFCLSSITFDASLNVDVMVAILDLEVPLKMLGCSHRRIDTGSLYGLSLGSFHS